MGGAGLAGFGVRHGGAVAHRPQPGVARYGQVIVYRHRAALVVFDRQIPEQRVRRRPRRPDQRFGTDLLAGVQHDHTPSRIGHAGFKLERYAPLFHVREGIVGQRLAQLREDPPPRVDHDNPYFLGRDVGIVDQHTAHEVVQPAGQLRAREAATRHHEGHQRSADFRVWLAVGTLEYVDYVVADADRVP